MAEVIVIVINWNGRRFFSDCLNSLSNQSFKNFKVLFVDNGSTDGSIGFVKKHFPAFQVLPLQRNYGFAKANNLGIKMALQNKETHFVALLNNDMKAEPDWLENLVCFAKTNKLSGSYQSKILLFDNHKIINVIGISLSKNGMAGQLGFLEKDVGQYDASMEIFGASAGAVLYRREMLEHIGFFDEDFFAYYEDVDLAIRARCAGWNSMYVHSAIVYHRESSTLGKNSPAQIYYRDRNFFYYMTKNMPSRTLYKFFIQHIYSTARVLLSITKRIFLGDTAGVKHGLFRLKGRLDAVCGLPKMLKKRRKMRRSDVFNQTKIVKWLRQ